MSKTAFQVGYDAAWAGGVYVNASGGYEPSTAACLEFVALFGACERPFGLPDNRPEALAWRRGWDAGVEARAAESER